MKKAIIINSEEFGKGDASLGLKLMGAFLRKNSLIIMGF